jgi:hypothetical protein
MKKNEEKPWISLRVETGRWAEVYQLPLAAVPHSHPINFDTSLSDGSGDSKRWWSRNEENNIGFVRTASGLHMTAFRQTPATCGA